jgi:hypothetical protein
MDGGIQPLPKALYERAKKDGVIRIFLEFSGGSDQGYLEVDIDHQQGVEPKDVSLASDIESWAEDVYNYSGAGDGNPYGDNVTYDLKNNKVSTEEWFMRRVKGDTNIEKLLVVDEDGDGDEDSDGDGDEE